MTVAAWYALIGGIYWGVRAMKVADLMKEGKLATKDAFDVLVSATITAVLWPAIFVIWLLDDRGK